MSYFTKQLHQLLLPALSVISVLLISCFTHVTTTHAQLLGGTTGTGISVSVKPQHPRPGDVVTIESTGYSYDSYRSNHRWFVNGDLMDEGVGKRTFTFRAGPLGSRTRVNLAIATDQGALVERDITITPAIVAITWEGATYLPPLYKGVAQHTASSFVRFVAVPSLHREDGTRIPPEELVYLWKLDERVQTEHSGLGKMAMELENDRFTRDLPISVEVSTFDRSQTAEDTKIVEAEDPEFILYQIHPLLGVLYEQALDNRVTLGEQEASILAEPYYYSLASREDPVLDYIWQLDRQDLDAKSILTIRPTDTGSGAANLTLLGRHAKRFMQSARASLTIDFGDQ